MPTLAEILQSLRGALRLARGDTGGMQDFNLTADGFWRSFFAGVILLPPILLMSIAMSNLLVIDAPEMLPDQGRGPLGWFITYATPWLLYPVVAGTALHVMGQSGGFAAWIIARNWSTIICEAAQAPAVLFYIMGVIDLDAMQASYIVIICAVFIYQWFVARTALGVPGAVAAGLVILDGVLQLVVSNAMAAL